MSGPPKAIVGCLLDVSGSMREALEVGRQDQNATDRFQAVLRAALKLARAEQRHDRDALMFVGAFGLDVKSPPVVDLCSVVDSLVTVQGTNETGHQLLCGLATRNNVDHITKYIYDKLTDDQSRVVYGYLRRHPQRIQEFIEAIPSSYKIGTLRHGTRGLGAVALAVAFLPVGGPFGAMIGAGMGTMLGNSTGAAMENEAVEDSKALKLARQICDNWLRDFVDLKPRRLDEVVRLLEKVQEQHDRRQQRTGQKSVLDTIRDYIYGGTPMRAALQKSLVVFRQHSEMQQRVLVMISDGMSTDGDPLRVASEIRECKVDLATTYLTGDRVSINRQLHYEPAGNWNDGQRVLFEMATKVSCANHPIPVLASMGWRVPSSGEARLYATVSSSSVLEEFCSQLLSARFGSADALLNMIGKVQQDTFINDSHVRTCNNPSNQGNSATCYAHAIAAVIHMSLLRIVDYEGGVPSIEEIRKRILREFPSTSTGQVAEEVLKAATQWYRPLRYRKLDEDGARQAILHRRPVLTTFRLSKSGWRTFCRHFENTISRNTILTTEHMAAHRSPPDDGGHAVVLWGCSPSSLTFLNSWGNTWGKKGNFTITNPSVLEMSGVGVSAASSMRFYDVYWYDSDLTGKEREGYEKKAFDTLRDRANSGNVRQVLCPRAECQKAFAPEPGDLVKALYANSGLDDVA